MPIVLAAALFTTPPAAPVAAPLAADARPAPCERARTVPVADAVERPSVRPLGTMPPAKQILGVARLEGGCLRPIVMRDEVGQPRTGPSIAR